MNDKEILKEAYDSGLLQCRNPDKEQLFKLLRILSSYALENIQAYIQGVMDERNKKDE